MRVGGYRTNRITGTVIEIPTTTNISALSIPQISRKRNKSDKLGNTIKRKTSEERRDEVETKLIDDERYNKNVGHGNMWWPGWEGETKIGKGIQR